MKETSHTQSVDPAVPPAKRRFRRSIAWKLFSSTFFCLFILLVFNWLLNNFVLVSYYQNVKEKTLVSAFRQIDALYNGSAEEVEQEVYRLYSEENVRLKVWNRYGVLCSSYFDPPAVFSYNLPLVLLDNGTYLIETGEDPRTGSNSITLTGRFSNGYSVMMSTPIAAIEESIGISNQFLLISGGLTLLISTVLILFFARSFTRPIKELSRVAGSVSALDFTDRYTGKRDDELGDLGRSINAMSAALESTVSRLKSANLQLINDNEQKTKQNEARRAFITNVSHELKTPISLIQTYAEGLKEDIAGGAENRDFYCEVIEDDARKMSELIRKMTALMQLEAGSEQLVIKRFDVAGLARSLLLKNRPRFQQAEARVVPPPDEPVFVWGDAYLIENVLTNYLSNAINHVAKGGRIEVAIRHTAPERVRVSVYNTGEHIPPDDLNRIWESFYKVDKARTRAYGGTGIGLSVVAAIMKAHQMPYGVYNRQSASETGVEFYFELESR